MSGPWTVAFCVLACFTVMQGVLLLGLTRRSVKVLENLERLGAGSDLVLPNSGLSVGESVPEFLVKDVNGLPVQSSSLLGGPRTLLIASTGCPACDDVLRELRDAPQTVADHRLLVVMPDTEEGRQFAAPPDFEVFYQSPDLPVSEALDSHLTPHAFVLSGNGVVLSRGVGNTIGALNAAWEQAGQRAQDDAMTR